MFKGRISQELKILFRSPPPDVQVWQKSERDIQTLFAVMRGPRDSPYAGGKFYMKITLSEKYPLHPPLVRFLTKVYHPNIDESGRICLDALKLPPNGTWKPSLSVYSLLNMVKLLLLEPNPNDPLMIEIANLYVKNRSIWYERAQKCTEEHANMELTADIDEKEEIVQETEADSANQGLKRDYPKSQTESSTRKRFRKSTR